MRQTESTILLHAAEITPIAQLIRERIGTVRVQAIPTFSVMMESSPDYYPFQQDFDQARDDPIVVLHSSGSTGKTINPSVEGSLYKGRRPTTNHDDAWFICRRRQRTQSPKCCWS